MREARQSAVPPSSSSTQPASVQMRSRAQGRISGIEGFAAQEAALAPVQGKGPLAGDVHAAAAHGIAGGGGSLPYLDAVQRSFGHHDVSGVQAHTGARASEASGAMGAQAYATGNHVAFGGTPDLHTVAHEAAHVVQQRSGVSLSGGVGQSGDRYEQHADAVADKVVRGESASGVLDEMAGGSRGGGGVQHLAVQRKVVSAGAELAQVQERLNKLGFDCGAADGLMGPKTRAGIGAFQRARGLVADGIVGPLTLGAIDEAEKGGAAPAAAPAAATPAAETPAAATPATSTPASTPASTTTPAAPASGGGASAPAPAAAKGAAAQPETPKEEDAPPPPPTSSKRSAIVGAARSKIGTVASDSSGGVDAGTGDHVRKGWESLTDIFSVGMPSFPKQVIKFLKFGKNNGSPPNPNGLVSWCGIFATWAVKSGGGDASAWQGGNTIVNAKKMTRDPRPGDVGYFPNNNHHMCIIAAVNGDSIETIDGNSFDQGNGGSGTIVSKMRSKASIPLFYNNAGD